MLTMILLQPVNTTTVCAVNYTKYPGSESAIQRNGVNIVE